MRKSVILIGILLISLLPIGTVSAGGLPRQLFQAFSGGTFIFDRVTNELHLRFAEGQVVVSDLDEKRVVWGPQAQIGFQEGEDFYVISQPLQTGGGVSVAVYDLLSGTELLWREEWGVSELAAAGIFDQVIAVPQAGGFSYFSTVDWQLLFSLQNTEAGVSVFNAAGQQIFGGDLILADVSAAGLLLTDEDDSLWLVAQDRPVQPILESVEGAYFQQATVVALGFYNDAVPDVRVLSLSGETLYAGEYFNDMEWSATGYSRRVHSDGITISVSFGWDGNTTGMNWAYPLENVQVWADFSWGEILYRTDGEFFFVWKDGLDKEITFTDTGIALASGEMLFEFSQLAGGAAAEVWFEFTEAGVLVENGAGGWSMISYDGSLLWEKPEWELGYVIAAEAVFYKDAGAVWQVVDLVTGEASYDPQS